MERKIYSKLAEKAKEVFDCLEIPSGVYSAKDVNNLIPFTTKGVDPEKISTPIYDGRWKMDPMETISVSEGSFGCEFKAWRIFAYMAKFEKLVPAKDRVKFEKVAEEGTHCLELVVPKNIGKLPKCVGKDELRPVMDYVCYDVERHALVATDGYVLSVVHCDCELFSEEHKTSMILIDASLIKKDAEISISKTEFGYCANNIVINEMRYPKWHAVIPKFHEDEEIKFDKKAWKVLQKAVKEISKACKMEYIHLLADEGNNSITVKGDNAAYNIIQEKNIEVPCVIRKSFHVAVNAKSFAKIDEADSMWIQGGDRALGFTNDKKMMLLMPTNASEIIPADKRERNIDLLNLSRIVCKEKDAIIPAPKAEVKEAEEKHLPVPVVKSLPVPVVKVETVPVAIPCEITPIVEKQIEDAEIVEEIKNEPKEVVAEKKSVNGISEGDFVSLKIFSGEEIITKVLTFTDNGRVRLFIKSCTFNFSLDEIKPTDAKKKTSPTWLKVGKTITDGKFVSEITKINRSSVEFADGETRKLLYLLTNCRPATEEEKSSVQVVTAKEVEMQPKKERFSWIKKIIRKAAIFSF